MGRYIKPLEFSDKFDHSDDPTDTRGMNVLTVTGCMKRHELTRDEMMNTSKENIMRSMSYSNRAERDEKFLMNKVSTLLAQGHKISPSDMSLEDFVERIHNDNL